MMLQQQVTNRKWYTTYLIAAIVMTFGVAEGHFLIASFFKWVIL